MWDDRRLEWKESLDSSTIHLRFPSFGKRQQYYIRITKQLSIESWDETIDKRMIIVLRSALDLHSREAYQEQRLSN
jgi:hypothetical protein